MLVNNLSPSQAVSITQAMETTAADSSIVNVFTKAGLSVTSAHITVSGAAPTSKPTLRHSGGSVFLTAVPSFYPTGPVALNSQQSPALHKSILEGFSYEGSILVIAAIVGAMVFIICFGVTAFVFRKKSTKILQQPGASEHVRQFQQSNDELHPDQNLNQLAEKIGQHTYPKTTDMLAQPKYCP